MLVEEPLAVVRLDKLSNRLMRLVECVEIVQVQTFFLQRPDPTLRDAVTLGLAHVVRSRPDAEPPELPEELVSRVLWPPIRAEPKAQGNAN